MSLTFYTQPHQMTFVDPAGNLVNAWSLPPETDFHVYFVIQNDAPVLEHNVQVWVTHSAFGIGLPGGTSQIVQQPLPLDVPPKGPGGNGLATGVFVYHTPEAGHGCLYANILPAGPGLPQNTDVATVPRGASSTITFLVFNELNVPRAITLKATELEVLPSGATVPPAPSWLPSLIPPPDIPSVQPNPKECTLNMPPLICRTAGLQVAVPVAAFHAHVFTVDGYDGPVYINSIQRTLTPVPAAQWVPPDPYIVGTYQSPDVILYNPAGLEIPIGGGGAYWDTSLIPGVAYGLAARVHNASATDAVHVEVHFWEFWGGVGAAGSLLSVETVSVPAFGEAIVHSSVPFHAAPYGQHKCAVVSIYDSLAGTCTNAWASGAVPDPEAQWDHSCSAWRNCTSRLIQILQPWHFLLQPALQVKKLPLLDLDVAAFHVARDWEKLPQVQEMRARIKKQPALARMPLYLLPELRETLTPLPLKEIDLRIETKAEQERVEPRARVADSAAAAGLRLRPVERKEYAPLAVSGKVPEGAKEGDILLIEVTVHYPGAEGMRARSMKYMEILHIGEGR